MPFDLQPPYPKKQVKKCWNLALKVGNEGQILQFFIQKQPFHELLFQIGLFLTLHYLVNDVMWVYDRTDFHSLTRWRFNVNWRTFQKVEIRPLTM